MVGDGRAIVRCSMKPTIPDTGTVIRLEGELAVLHMNHERSCGKCGAAALGLCKGGLMQELTVRNSKQARVGDSVKISLVQATQFKGYVLAYVVPPAALVAGAAGGYFLGAYTGFPPLDIIMGFLSMLVVSFFSLRRLKSLDAAHSIEIVQVFSGPVNPGSRKSDEETISDYYLSYF
jgi:positive regulator of sigma E activity